MGLRINTNTASLGAQRQLFAATDRLTGSLSRLSSGLRIARAADDAAGLGISERMRADVRSLAAAERNIGDGIGLVRTAEGAIGQLHDQMTRIRELALRSLNGTLSDDDRETLNTEYEAIVTGLERIIGDTEFNGNSLLSTAATIDIQAGSDATQTVSVTTPGLAGYATVLSFFDVRTDFGADLAILVADLAIDAFSQARGELGAAENQLQSALRTTQVAREATAASESRIRDVDVAAETADLVRGRILQEAAASVLAQANVAPSLALQLLGG